MGEESGLPLASSVQPVPGPGEPAPESLELLHGPSNEVLVDVARKGVQPGAIEGPVVVDPASDLGVDVLGEAGQVRSAAAFEVPVPDLLVHRLSRFPADGRVEAHEVAPWSLDPAAPEGVAEEVEAGVLEVPPAAAVFAVDDPRLVGVQPEAEGPEAVGDGGPEVPGVALGVAVDDDVVRLCRGPDYAEEGLETHWAGGARVEMLGIIKELRGRPSGRPMPCSAQALCPVVPCEPGHVP
jgi:hypothetical protein